MEKIRVGIIGFGRMGEKYLKQMRRSDLWEVSYICDVSPCSRKVAEEMCPECKVVDDEDIIFNDPSIQAVCLCALADSRSGQIAKAISHGKHIIAEKPIGSSREQQQEILQLAEASPVLSTVNLYLRNSWYHKQMKDFIASGEIGELAIIRICHMTPGLAPKEGHEYEGPAFHDCGMHYVDIARWYAGSEYSSWHAQGMRMWNYKDPWWLQCHGTFQNGVVFDITQGFVYGQLSKDQTHNSYTDIIGTKGIVRMTHDFRTAVVELRGVTKTERIEKDFGEKNLDVLCERFARSVISGKADPELPSFRDSVIASCYANRFIEDARKNDLPAIGDEKTLDEILYRRSTMTNGYGLLPRRKNK